MPTQEYSIWRDLLAYLFYFAVNCIVGIIAVSMSKKRGLKPVPAFFAALFTSVVSLFYIAMHPIKVDENQTKS